MTVTVTATPDDEEYTVAADLTVSATEANVPVTISELTVATGVRDVDGDLLSVSLADASVVSGALAFDTAPTVSLDASEQWDCCTKRRHRFRRHERRMDGDSGIG